MSPQKKQLVLDSCKRSVGMQHLGVEVLSIEQDKFEAFLKKKDFMIRPSGILTGGIISHLTDIVAGYTAVTAEQEDAYFSTVELKTNFLRPAKNDFLIGSGEVIKRGKRITVVSVKIYSSAIHPREQPNFKAEQPVAIALATLIKLNHRIVQ